MNLLSKLKYRTEVADTTSRIGFLSADVRKAIGDIFWKDVIKNSKLRRQVLLLVAKVIQPVEISKNLEEWIATHLEDAPTWV